MPPDSLEPHSSESELVAGVRAGDPVAFETLVARYGPTVTSAAFRVIHDLERANDIAHDVLLWLWDNRAELHVTTSLAAYLIVATRRRALNAARHDRVQRETGDEFLTAGKSPGMGDAPLPPDVALERRELATLLQRALDTLPPRAREVAALRWQEQLSRGEIAEILGITVSTVSNTLTMATRTVRAALERYARDYLGSD